MVGSDVVALGLGVVAVLVAWVMMGRLVRAEFGGDGLRRVALRADVRQRAERGEL